jgi:hypothetical protein
MAAHHLCLLAEVSLREFVQWQVLGAALRTFPEEVGVERGPKALVNRWASLEEVQAWS